MGVLGGWMCGSCAGREKEEGGRAGEGQRIERGRREGGREKDRD